MHELAEKYATGKYGVLLIACCSVAAVFTVDHARAMVTGSCSNCHTMHNSQDGTSLSSQPQNYLLADDCVGCHSSSGPDTIVTLGSTRIPIVFNTTAYPAQPLAGGNFYKVSLGGAENDIYGHNVWGISGEDANLSLAPGQTANCSGSCHVSLATDPALTYGNGIWGWNGCTGCHQSTKHHGVSPASGSPETLESGWYRFLSGHDPNTTVYGIEDPDWEHNPSAGQNKYQGVDYYYFGINGMGLGIVHSMTGFCQGCHTSFHSRMSYGGSVSPWIVHPTDYALPTSGEYADYDPVNNYDPSVPVAWVDPSVPVREEAVVMCLSCHRAHGSEYPDMLRWDYDTIIANGGANSTGCFKCHSLKDE